MDRTVLEQFSVAGTPAHCLDRLVELTRRYPQVTGLRLKLPPLSGSESYPYYAEMMRGVAEIITRWPGR
jgi:hypothetical protein